MQPTTRSATSLAVLFTAALLAGCAVGPHHRVPAVPTPDAYRGSPATAALGDPGAPAPAGPALAERAWWEVFEDDALRGLIDEAMRTGGDVRLAAWRVEEARAAAGVARADRFPALQGAAGWSRGRSSSFLDPVSGTRDLYDVSLGLSWEVDLWGRIRHLEQAALSRYLATEQARRGVELSLQAEVARGYFELRALDAQLDVARRTAEAFRGTHGLFDRRLEAGLASPLETSSAAASLAATAASIPDLERRIAAQENRLSVLLGRPPGDIPRGAALDAQLLPPDVPAGLPSELLRRRPDLLEAEEELAAANAEVGVAVADKFPRIHLTGVFGGVAPQLSELLDEGKAWSAGGGLLTPLVQGRRLRDAHRAAAARWEQARVRYEQSVRNALAEVSTALVAYRKLADVERERARAVASFREAVDLSNARYLSGLAGYLDVLQAQQQLFPAENALAQTRFERLSALVELYRALGGGWRGGWRGDWQAGGQPGPEAS